jgi:hypothetical protein
MRGYVRCCARASVDACEAAVPVLPQCATGSASGSAGVAPVTPTLSTLVVIAAATARSRRWPACMRSKVPPNATHSNCKMPAASGGMMRAPLATSCRGGVRMGTVNCCSRAVSAVLHVNCASEVLACSTVNLTSASAPSAPVQRRMRHVVRNSLATLARVRSRLAGVPIAQLLQVAAFYLMLLTWPTLIKVRCNCDLSTWHGPQ